MYEAANEKESKSIHFFGMDLLHFLIWDWHIALSSILDAEFNTAYEIMKIHSKSRLHWFFGRKNLQFSKA